MISHRMTKRQIKTRAIKAKVQLINFIYLLIFIRNLSILLMTLRRLEHKFHGHEHFNINTRRFVSVRI